MTVNCIHKGYKAFCPKCHRMSPHGCWEEELNEAVSNGSTLQGEIMQELDVGLSEKLAEKLAQGDATKLEDVSVAPEQSKPTAPAKASRGGRRKGASK
jgi:dihydroneopterin aldolase